MKKLITILFIFCLQHVFATTYYVATNGLSTNSGTSSSAPWNFAKFSSFSFSSGDQVLFNRGDTFYGEIIVKNGSVTYGAYGTGAKPIITGFTTLTAWTNLGSNIWETTNAASTLPTCNIVLINGVTTPMGRYPNTGWFPYQSHNTATSLTSSSLDGVINWTGASVVMRRQRWYTEVDSITSQSGSTLNFTNQGLYSLQDNWGFFIENDARTLDVQNEWYYNLTTKKLRIYSTSQPSNVQIPTLQNVVQDSSNSTFVVIQDLNLTGANQAVVDFNFGKNATVNRCNISFGTAGIAFNGQAPTANDNNISYTGYTGIQSDQNGVGGNFLRDTITHNCPIEGSLVRGGGSAIYNVGASTLIQYCVVDSSAWGGINVYGSNSIADRNFVNHSCLIRDDAAGIATHGITTNNYSGVQITNNIVLNSIGNDAGTSTPGTSPEGNGIYCDDLTANAKISGNTVAGCSGVGLFLHRGTNDTIINNISYNNSAVSGNFTNGQIFFQYTSDPVLVGLRITGNIFFGTNSAQKVVKFSSSTSNTGFPSALGLDSNYYFNIAGGNLFYMTNGTTNNYDLPGWKTYSGLDAHSTSTLPKIPTIVDSVKLVYNATTSPVTTTLPYNYKDVYGNGYNGSITLQPFTSALLVQNGSIIVSAPTVTTSGDQTLPGTTSTNIFSTPVPASGHTITSVLWTQTVGAGATITSPTTNNTSITGLSGINTFRITVTQDDGQTAYADVTITVTAPPTANAGTNQTITLPVSSINLTGTGTTASGHTVTYQWTKVSGNGTQTIGNNTTLTPSISGLTTAGTYVFQLTVTQDDGQIATSTVTITVNAAITKQVPYINLRVPTQLKNL